MHSERRSILHRLTQRVQPFGAEALIIELPRTGVNVRCRIGLPSWRIGKSGRFVHVHSGSSEAVHSLLFTEYDSPIFDHQAA
jgi:hypothetical protein